MNHDTPLDTHYHFRTTSVHISVSILQDKNAFDRWSMEALYHYLHLHRTNSPVFLIHKYHYLRFVSAFLSNPGFFAFRESSYLCPCWFAGPSYVRILPLL
jgi:hypothetical protein